MAESSKGAIQKVREEYINRKGLLERISEIDAANITGQKQVRFTEGTNETYKIILKLKKDRVQTKRGKNFFKI